MHRVIGEGAVVVVYITDDSVFAAFGENVCILRNTVHSELIL